MMREYVENPTLAQANTIGAGIATGATVLLAAPGIAMGCAANPGLCQATVADLLNPNPGDLIPPVTTTARGARQFYEVWSEQAICGTSRSTHRAAANAGLFDQLSSDAQMRSAWDSALGADVLGHMSSGASSLRNPPGMIWHHPIEDPGVMQLMPGSQHTDPLFQDLLHPDGIGGFGAFYGN